MPCGGCHAPHLPVPTLAQPQFDPKILNIFSIAHGWIAGRPDGLGIQNPDARRQHGAAVKNDAAAKFLQGRLARQPLHKHLVGLFHMTPGRKQARIPSCLVGKQQQAFGVGIQAPDGIHAFRKPEFRQRPVRAAVRREPGENAVGFVEGEDQRTLSRVRSWESTTPMGRWFSSSTTRSSMRWRSRI